MKIVVCVKQVPRSDHIKINSETNTLVRDGVEGMLNPFDEFAVEEALQIRERFGGQVGIVSMGPPQAEESIATCLAMGADKGYLLSDVCLSGSDTLATSFALSRIMKRIGFDLILCGQETTDSSTAQVGPELAELLDIPQVTYAMKIDLFREQNRFVVKAKRETDTGYQMIETKLPALLTVVKGINSPRQPGGLGSSDSLVRVDAGYLRCDREKLGLDGSPTRVVKIVPVTHRTRQHAIIDSNLSAEQRLDLLITGGIKGKDSATRVHEDPEGAARKTVDYIRELGPWPFT